MIRWKSFAKGRGASICVTCSWGTVRNGYRDGEVETICRLVDPNSLVSFPVRECTGYVDSRTPALDSRSFGFVTTISLQDKEIPLHSGENPKNK